MRERVVVVLSWVVVTAAGSACGTEREERREEPSSIVVVVREGDPVARVDMQMRLIDQKVQSLDSLARSQDGSHGVYTLRFADLRRKASLVRMRYFAFMGRCASERQWLALEDDMDQLTTGIDQLALEVREDQGTSERMAVAQHQDR